MVPGSQRRDCRGCRGRGPGPRVHGSAPPLWRGPRCDWSAVDPGDVAGRGGDVRRVRGDRSVRRSPGQSPPGADNGRAPDTGSGRGVRRHDPSGCSDAPAGRHRHTDAAAQPARRAGQRDPGPDAHANAGSDERPDARPDERRDPYAEATHRGVHLHRRWARGDVHEHEQGREHLVMGVRRRFDLRGAPSCAHLREGRRVRGHADRRRRQRRHRDRSAASHGRTLTVPEGTGAGRHFAGGHAAGQTGNSQRNPIASTPRMAAPRPTTITAGPAGRNDACSISRRPLR
jgi:hypothetical protein